jgi:hypothetical protein
LNNRCPLTLRPIPASSANPPFILTNQERQILSERIIAATSVSIDPSHSVFFKQLVGSPAPESLLRDIRDAAF